MGLDGHVQAPHPVSTSALTGSPPSLTPGKAVVCMGMPQVPRTSTDLTSAVTSSFPDHQYLPLLTPSCYHTNTFDTPQRNLAMTLCSLQTPPNPSDLWNKTSCCWLKLCSPLPFPSTPQPTKVRPASLPLLRMLWPRHQSPGTVAAGSLASALRKGLEATISLSATCRDFAPAFPPI